MQRVKINGGLAARGVYVAPWLGDNGEMLLAAVSSEHKLIGDLVPVPVGSNHVAASDAMWERLERDNPIPVLRVI